jgi:hypothetical protein
MTKRIKWNILIDLCLKDIYTKNECKFLEEEIIETDFEEYYYERRTRQI